MNLPRQSRAIVIKLADRVSIAVCNADKIAVDLHILISVINSFPSIILQFAYRVWPSGGSPPVFNMARNTRVKKQPPISYDTIHQHSHCVLWTTSLRDLFFLPSLVLAIFSKALTTKTALDVAWEIVWVDVLVDVGDDRFCEELLGEVAIVYNWSVEKRLPVIEKWVSLCLCIHPRACEYLFL